MSDRRFPHGDVPQFRISMDPPKQVVGDMQGAEIEVEVYEFEGEREYNVRCLCPACWQMEEIGSDAFDPDKTLEVGTVYYMKSWFEEYHTPFVGTDYDSGIDIHYQKEDQ